MSYFHLKGRQENLEKPLKNQLQRRPLALLLIILAWSLTLGWLLSSTAYSATPNTTIGTVDLVPAQYQLGKQLYLEKCATCHIALPPEVLPTQTWRNLLQDREHYGVQLKALVDPPRTLIWRYISTFSRVQLQDEVTPYRLKDSRYFKALHPGVNLPRPVQIGSCVTCHPGAGEYNFRSLSAEWEEK